jgi:hypothetical protein
MTSIDPEFAVESLWQALEWELPKSTAVFDEIAHHLRRSPRFRGMSITEIDLLLADARREFVRDLDDFEWRLVHAFKDAIGFDEADGDAA